MGTPPSPYGLGLNEYVWSFFVTPAPRLYLTLSQTGSANPRIWGWGVVPRCIFRAPGILKESTISVFRF